MNRAALFLLLSCFALPSLAAEQLVGLESDPTFPPIPDVFDLEISEKEWAKVKDGKIITQIVARGSEDRQARAIGYLKSNPLELFDIATDSALAPEIVPEVEEVIVEETRPRGKLFNGRADFSFVLPEFEYTLASAYDESRTGQAWAQVKGDFDKNEGTHAFFWDPERQETLAVMTFDFALKGILSMVPELVIVSIAKETLPDFMRSVDEMPVKIAERDKERGDRIAVEWPVLREQLESGVYPHRVWKGYPIPAPPEVAVTIQHTVPEPVTAELAAVDGAAIGEEAPAAAGDASHGSPTTDRP